jgi:hypothetical protein
VLAYAFKRLVTPLSTQSCAMQTAQQCLVSLSQLGARASAVYGCFDGGKREKFIGSSADKFRPRLDGIPSSQIRIPFLENERGDEIFLSLFSP